jgi:hypothetical protein
MSSCSYKYIVKEFLLLIPLTYIHIIEGIGESVFEGNFSVTFDIDRDAVKSRMSSKVSITGERINIIRTINHIMRYRWMM